MLFGGPLVGLLGLSNVLFVGLREEERANDAVAGRLAGEDAEDAEVPGEQEEEAEEGKEEED